MLDKLYYKELRFKHDQDYRWMYTGILNALFSYDKPAYKFNYWPLEYCMDAKVE